MPEEPRPRLGEAHAHLQANLQAELQAELDRSLAADPSLPGILATVQAPGLTWSGAAGTGVEPGQAFRIASVTKVFTALAALRLVEAGAWGLFDAIAPWLDESTQAALRRGGHDPHQITLFDLLTHTSGLPDHAAAAAYRQDVLARPQHHWTRAEQIARATDLPAVAPRGSRFSYSDTGYVIVGEMLERVTGQPLHAVLRQQGAFDRLGLSQTHFESLEPTPPGQRRALQRIGTLDVATLHPSMDLYGGGGLVSTTEELVCWLRAALRGKLFEQPATLATALMTPSVAFAPGDVLHACLLRGRFVGGHACWTHGGFWGLVVAHFPANDVTLAVSYNQADCAERTRGTPTHAGLADRLAAIVHHALGDLPVARPHPLPP